MPSSLRRCSCCGVTGASFKVLGSGGVSVAVTSGSSPPVQQVSGPGSGL
jgi:hypothetical protein